MVGFIAWASGECMLIAATCYLVHKSASDKDIRAAYKRLSKKFHPDKNKAADAEARFVEIARGQR